jgi:uncharacterized protein YuzB (UPF0349 family)
MIVDDDDDDGVARDCLTYCYIVGWLRGLFELVDSDAAHSESVTYL